jgi:hypothetical protein
MECVGEPVKLRRYVDFPEQPTGSKTAAPAADD